MSEDEGFSGAHSDTPEVEFILCLRIWSGHSLSDGIVFSDGSTARCDDEVSLGGGGFEGIIEGFYLVGDDSEIDRGGADLGEVVFKEDAV